MADASSGAERVRMAEELLRILFRRDSPWAAEWQIEEAVTRRRAWLNGLSESDQIKFLANLQKKTADASEANFSAWLQHELELRGMTQSQLARTIHTYPSAVSKWVNGKQRPRPEQCTRIADAFRVPHEVVMNAAGYTPYLSEYIVEDFLVDSDIRNEALNLLMEIPEALVIPLLPMLRGLAETAKETHDRVRESILHEQSGIY